MDRRFSLAIALLTTLVFTSLLIALTTDLVPLWKALTELGSEALYVLISILIYVAIDHRLGFRCMQSVLLTASLTLLLKEMLRLPRPPQSLWRVEAYGYGFPSGHAATSTAFWTTLALYVLYIVPLAIAIILAVSISRIALGVHYLHDVVGGIALGLSVSIALYLWRYRYKTICIACTVISTVSSIVAAYRASDIGTKIVALMILGFALSMSMYIKLAPRVDVAQTKLYRVPITKRIAVAITIALALAATVKAVEVMLPIQILTLVSLSIGLIVLCLPIALERILVPRL